MIFRKIFLILIALTLSSPTFAAHLDLAWDSNSEPDLAGYIVYYGTSSGNYTDWTDVGRATSVRITGLSANRKYFVALTAYDVYGNESDFSAEVAGDPLPGDDPAPPSGGGFTIDSGSSSGGGCIFTTAR
jgi:hypothetical protein